MTTTTTKTTTITPKIVSQAEWLAARKQLLAKEKQFTHERDALSAERRKMPWVKVEKDYMFDGPKGKVRLADLFAGHSQLIIYHFMFGPEWQEGCPSCSFLADHFNSIIVHLNARDTSFAAVSRAPIEKLQPFEQRMGWNFHWLSSLGNDFNRDYHVSFAPEEVAEGEVYYNYGVQKFPSEEAPGLSVFYKNPKGEIFHTYSTYGRGLDILLGAYNFLDLTPKGRDEDALPYPMSWVRHHDRYSDSRLVNPTLQERYAQLQGVR